MRISLKYLAAVGVAVALSIPGMASALTVAGDWNITQLQTSDPGLVVQTSHSGGSFSKDLEVGQSYSFNLFKIWTDESSVNGGEDTVASPIGVKFDFTSPSTSGSVGGTTQGVNFLGLVQWGQLDWASPVAVAFGAGNTGKLLITLSDAIFNKGAFGLHDGEKFGAKVKATITYKAAPVPLPATLPLLIGGLALVGAVRRRAQSRVA